MEAKDDVQQTDVRITRQHTQLKRHHSTEDVSGALHTANGGFIVVTRQNKKIKKHQQQAKLLSSDLSGSMGNSVVDDAIEFVASQGGSQPNYKCGDGDGVRMETQRKERIDALEKLVNQQDRTIKLLCTRLNFVMSMLGISDDVSLSHKEIIELDNNEEFPYLSAAITKSDIRSQ